jgi:hypothetical protein
MTALSIVSIRNLFNILIHFTFRRIKKSLDLVKFKELIQFRFPFKTVN